jgi:hypothetical protein
MTNISPERAKRNAEVRAQIEPILRDPTPTPMNSIEAVSDEVVSAEPAAIIDQAMDCDAWPKWLSDLVELTNQASDAADMSTEQAVAYGILQALRSPIQGEVKDWKPVRDELSGYYGLVNEQSDLRIRTNDERLRNRIAAALSSPAPEPIAEAVAYMLPVTHEVLGQTGWAFYSRLTDPQDYEPGEYEKHVLSISGAIPLYATPPSPKPEAVSDEQIERLTRPIIGISNRSALEVFDIMSDRIRAALSTNRSETP